MTERVIRIVLDDSQAVGGLGRLERGLGRTETGATKTGRAFRGMAAAATALIAALGIREFIQYADLMTNLESRLRLVTDSTAELKAVQDELFQLAQETNTSLEGTITLYQRTAIATEGLNLSQKELIQFSRTVSQTLQISGATAAEAAGSTLQLSQALASDRFAGDELRGFLEGNAAGARALAKGLSQDVELLSELDGANADEAIEITIGLLRELGSSGQLNSERVVKAFLTMSEEVDEQFGTIEDTTGRALQRMENSFIRFVGVLDDELELTGISTGAIDSLTEFIDFAHDNISAVGDVVAVLGVQFDILADSIDFSAVGDAIVDLTGFLFDSSIALQELAFDGHNVVDILSEEFPSLSKELENAFLDPIGFITDAFVMLPTNVITSIRIVVFETLAAFDQLLLDLAEGVNSISILAGIHLFSEETIAGLREDAIAGEKALVILREKEFETLEEIRLKIAETNAANQLERDAALAAREAARARLGERDDPSRGIGSVGSSDGLTSKQREAGNDLLEDLTRSFEDAALATVLFDEALDAANLRVKVARELADEGITGELADEINTATEALIRQNEAQERAEELRDNKIDDDELLDALADEIELLKLGDVEREIEIELRKLSADATDEQKEAVRQLVTELELLKDAEDDARESVAAFLEDVSGAITETVFDGFRNGFDDIETEFANFLTNLAQQIAESAIANALKDLFDVQKGGSGGGGFVGVLASVFAGSGAHGLDIGPGQFGLVGEEGPEFISGGTGGATITPIGGGIAPTIVIVNEQDPEAIVSGLDTRRGIFKQRNRVTADRRQMRRTLGVR